MTHNMDPPAAPSLRALHVEMDQAVAAAFAVHRAGPRKTDSYHWN